MLKGLSSASNENPKPVAFTCVNHIKKDSVISCSYYKRSPFFLYACWCVNMALIKKQNKSLKWFYMSTSIYSSQRVLQPMKTLVWCILHICCRFGGEGSVWASSQWIPVSMWILLTELIPQTWTWIFIKPATQNTLHCKEEVRAAERAAAANSVSLTVRVTVRKYLIIVSDTRYTAVNVPIIILQTAGASEPKQVLLQCSAWTLCLINLKQDNSSYRLTRTLYFYISAFSSNFTDVNLHKPENPDCSQSELYYSNNWNAHFLL